MRSRVLRTGTIGSPQVAKTKIGGVSGVMAPTRSGMRWPSGRPICAIVTG